MTSTGGGRGIDQVPRSTLVRLARTMFQALDHDKMGRLLRIPVDHPEHGDRFPAEDPDGPVEQARALVVILDLFDIEPPGYLDGYR